MNQRKNSGSDSAHTTIATTTGPTILDGSIIPALAPVLTKALSDLWQHPAVIQPNNFKFKSLSEWCLNTAIGCTHGCRFCYVPSTSVNKQEGKLKELGVDDPDSQWGQYVFPRKWDKNKFLASLKKAEETPAGDLKADGNRAVMLCSTTDPYQVIKNADPKKGKELTGAHQKLVRDALKLLLKKSTLNVRILTRSPLAKTDFKLMKKFGDRLLFGVSLPTLKDKLARIYEPNAPSPSQRLATLKAAKAAGLHVFVAIAPTYPECDEADLRATLAAVKELDPVTIFHEPINIRAENVERIRLHGEKLGITVKTEVFATPEAWENYFISQLKLVERIAGELGVGDRLHLWPDKSLGSKQSLARATDPAAHKAWLEKYWNRVSEWPGKVTVQKPDARVLQEEIKAITEKPRLTVRKPGEILAMQFNDADLYLENGIFSKGNPLTILGPGGVGKSRGLLQLAICTIIQREFIGWKVGARRLKWLIIQTENSNRRLKGDLEKLKAWVGAADWKKVEENLIIHTIEAAHDGFLGLNDRESQEMVAHLIKEHQADVVVFDPLFAFAAGNLNTDAGMMKTCRTISDLVRLGKPDACPVILHHTLTGKAGIVKATGYDRASYGRGSKSLQFWTRGQINVAPGAAEDNTKLVISCGKNSNGADFEPFGVKLNTTTMVYEIDPDFNLEAWKADVAGVAGGKDKATPEAVAELVADLPMKRKDLLLAIMEEFGCEKSTAYTLIGKAETKGTIRMKAKKYEKV